MAGDFSRNTFDSRKHFSGVLMQQGRVLVDAEWNEQLAIQHHRTHAETRDVVGRCGTPKAEDGFHISQTPQGDDLLIAPGRYYVDGLLCELDATAVPVSVANSDNQAILPDLYVDGYDLAPDQWIELSAAQKASPLYARITSIDPANLVLTLDADISAYRNAGAVSLRRAITYTTQPFYPSPQTVLSSPPNSPSGTAPINLSDGSYLVFLEAWQREVNALEQPRIREVAIGTDTTERLQTVWQVHLLPVTTAGGITSPPISSPPEVAAACCGDFPEWKKQIAPPTGLLNARTVTPSSDKNPCVLPPTAGYQRLLNQLYRVEVFQGGDSISQSTFVWSRDNASVESSIVKLDGSDVYVTSLGKDDYFSFASGQWVEIVDPNSEYSGTPRFLAQITAPPDTSGPNPKLTLSLNPPAFLDVSKLRLRRWDMTGSSVSASGLKMSAGWTDIEAGIQVQFLEGTFKTGDYWEIPARTANGEIEWPPFEVPNVNPVPQSPLGTRHHFCCLAHLTVSGTSWNIQDCRKAFPALTAICADDVCYEGTCDLPGIKTVQDAIDQLCQQRDLRFHNQHLHGWGIVCGLQVSCGPDSAKPRRHVTVKSGYAINCKGEDVVIDNDQQLDALSMAQQLPAPPVTSPPTSPQLGFPNGDYSLILDPAVAGNFRLEKYVPPKFSDAILKDTLLLDIIGCVQNLIDFIKGQFVTSPPGSEPVGPGQRLTTSVGSLVIQYNNADVGSYVFLSGESNPDQETPYHEDFILRDFYNKLRQELQSKTYCGMFDKARQFPAYRYSGTKIATMFGKDDRTRFRVEPSGAFSYAFGADSSIHVYDLSLQRMVAIQQFPDTGVSAGDVVVRDMAFSTDGKQLFAIATISGQHTMFATATISGNQLAWQQQVLIANIVLTTLATWSGAPGVVFAVGFGKGLYRIDVKDVFINPNLTPAFSFNAFDHLVVDDTSGEGLATALSSLSAPPTDHFDEVMYISLKEGITRPYPLANLNGQGKSEDDVFLVSPQGNSDQLRIFIVATLTGKTTKQLLVLDRNGILQGATPQILDLGETGAVKLAYNESTQFLMTTQGNNYRLMLVDIAKPELLSNVFPVQVHPAWIGSHAKTKMVYVLNTSSNTISAIPADQLAPSKQLDLTALVDYRSGVINSFWDLLGGLLEYLKDCICDHLLVECPTCDADDQLFLGVVSIRENQVFKICNFAQRKYVKSFPTVGYWLSAIPIIPILSKLVESICCAALPDLFAKQKAPQPSQSAMTNPATGFGGNMIIKTDTLQGAMSLFRQTSFKNMASNALTRLVPAPRIITDFLASKAPPSAPVTLPTQIVRAPDVVGISVDQAKARLTGAGVEVTNVARYDPGALPTNFARYVASPESIKPGESVSLVADDKGQVRYYTRNSTDVAALHAEVQSTQQQVTLAVENVDHISTLATQLKASVEATQNTLTASQPLLNAASSLQDRMATLETQVAGQKAEVQASADQIKTTVAAVEQLNRTSQQLRDSMQAAQSTLSASQPGLDAAQNLQGQIEALKAELASQKASTDQALTARDQLIAKLTAHADTLQTQIQQISVKLPGDIKNPGGAGGGGING